jgi:hypothetical protein
MRKLITSRIMPRTTLNLDATVLRELKRRQERDPRPLGELASELLARALAETEQPAAAANPLEWRSRRMRARVDLEDRDAVQELLDRGAG